MEDLSQVILLGHSYGGMVISGVLDRVPDRINAVIYSDAYVPDDGQSCFGLTNDLFRKLFLDNAATDGFSVLPPSGHDPRMTPHPLATFIQSLCVTNPPPLVKRGFIYLSGWADSPFTSTYERLCRMPEWRTFNLPVGHNVIEFAFDELLEIALQFI